MRRGKQIKGEEASAESKIAVRVDIYLLNLHA